TGAASCFLLLGGRVFAARDGTSVAAGDLAGLVERNSRPLTDADHAAGDPATAGRPILKPERFRAAGKDADAEALDQLVPEKFLLLFRPGFANQRLGQLRGFGHVHTLVNALVSIRQPIDSTGRDREPTARSGALWWNMPTNQGERGGLAVFSTARYGALWRSHFSTL